MHKAQIGGMVESLESRQFRSVTYYNDGSQADADGTYFGEILFGDNGDRNGMPSSAIGKNDQVMGVAYTNWTPDVDDGVDSGLQDALFSINASTGNDAYFIAGSDEAGEFSLPASMSVHSVELRAAVAGPGMEFVFSGIRLDFYHGASVVETIRVNNLDANSLNATSWDGAEAAAVIRPTTSNITGVQVKATFLMKTNAGVTPGPTDMTGQIYVS